MQFRGGLYKVQGSLSMLKTVVSLRPFGLTPNKILSPYTDISLLFGVCVKFVLCGYSHHIGVFSLSYKEF